MMTQESADGVVPEFGKNVSHQIDTGLSLSLSLPNTPLKTPFLFPNGTDLDFLSMADDAYSSKISHTMSVDPSLYGNPFSPCNLLQNLDSENGDMIVPDEPEQLTDKAEKNSVKLEIQEPPSPSTSAETIESSDQNNDVLKLKSARRASSRAKKAIKQTATLLGDINAGKRKKPAPKPVQPLPLPEDGILPPDHMPARGRRRKIQLQQMTPEQIKAEAEARMEKNRRSARDCRRRKKNYIETLDKQLQAMATRDRKQQKLIATLESQVASLQRELAKAKGL